MKKLRVSSQINLHFSSKNDIIKYIKDGITFSKKSGFDAMDFPTKEIVQLFGDEGEWKGAAEEVAEFAKGMGIAFEVCHLPFTIWSRICHSEEEIASFEKSVHTAIDAAAILGAKYAVLHPNTVPLSPDEYNEKKQFLQVIKHVAPFVEHAEKAGVKIAMENMILRSSDGDKHRYCQSAQELLRVCQRLGTDACWDFGHGNTIYKKQSEPISVLGEKIKVLHVNDNFGYDDDHLPPFFGTVDWEDSMKALKKAGFRGLLNYEIKQTAESSTQSELNAKYLMEAAERLNSYYERG